MTILEPSAGRGALISAALRREPYLNIIAVDIDPEHVQHLAALVPRGLAQGAYLGDFIKIPLRHPMAAVDCLFDRVLSKPSA